MGEDTPYEHKPVKGGRAEGRSGRTQEGDNRVWGHSPGYGSLTEKRVAEWFHAFLYKFFMATGSTIGTHGFANRKRQCPITHSGRFQLSCWSANLILRLEAQLPEPWADMRVLSWDARILGRSVCRNQHKGA